ncbi:hypothetical protein GCM10011376_40190 [Nocardioides flavus (ex Wang et al. 2016)]|uniref:Uncharacterized protein n=1 Tax=Nocardioides flavus (ex Wang et al. 2016) TaxID=2058780 RepID=A0ABQ3HU21_9ACTN|nr:hypothetical protein GCM10011376_40190 [Nocardioides flavus (ex Wang et al. 2016)]
MSPRPDWQTVAARIGRHLPWEYDYEHDDQVNERADLARLAHSFWHDELGDQGEGAGEPQLER